MTRIAASFFHTVKLARSDNCGYYKYVKKCLPEKEENEMGIIWGLILGAIAGLIASKLMNENSGMIKNILLGIGGGFVGSLVFSLLGFAATGVIGSLIVSVVGACICIWAGRKLFK